WQLELLIFLFPIAFEDHLFFLFLLAEIALLLYLTAKISKNVSFLISKIVSHLQKLEPASKARDEGPNGFLQVALEMFCNASLCIFTKNKAFLW
ncbi:MAG TPA: hypothetical protein VN457_01830, partial [Chlamydiales bacterium]|nr:hypothetical protein [Chlamydiales bacterium]